MIQDILAVMWKEWRELVFHPASLRSTLATAGVIVVLLGVVFPLKVGAAWLDSPLYLAYWGWVPSMLVSTLIADSFAGERERHTLDTLLASRLGDLAILFGKIGTSLAYSSVITFTLLGVGMLTVNVAHWTGRPGLYTPLMGAAAISITLFVSAATAAAGALASLQAGTVRQAQQTLNSVLMTLGLLPLLVAELLPAALRAQLIDWGAGLNPVVWVSAGSISLLALDVVLLAAASHRFQRSRLLVRTELAQSGFRSYRAWYGLLSP